MLLIFTDSIYTCNYQIPCQTFSALLVSVLKSFLICHFSLHSNSQLDINIKGHMIRDLMNIAGFRVPDKADVAHASPSPASNDFR